MNKQREILYGFRNQIIHGEDVRDRIMDIMEEVVLQKVQQFTTAEFDENEWKSRQLCDWVNLNFPLGLPEGKSTPPPRLAPKLRWKAPSTTDSAEAQFSVCTFISDAVRKAYDLKISFEEPEALHSVERYTVLSAIDRLWQEHLYEMDSLRYSIGLRAHGQRDPLIEYKAEAFKLFQELMVNIKIRDLPQHLPQRLEPDGVRELSAQHPPAHRSSGRQRLRRHHHRLLGRPCRSCHHRESRRSRGRGDGRDGQGQAGPHRSKGRPQRPLPLRLWQEVQAVLRQVAAAEPPRS
jgi:preprotein translocase subunit SecA